MQTQLEVEVLPAVRMQPPMGLMGATVWDDSTEWCAWQGAIESWLAAKRRRSGGENTARAYSLALRQFVEFAGVGLWQVGSGHAQAWAAHMGRVMVDGHPLAAGSVALKLAALSSFYEYVQRRYQVPTPDGRQVSLWPADRANPFTVVERPKISAYGRAHYPTTDQVQLILDAINTKCVTGKRDFALLYTFVTTCRRCSEVLHLRWGDLRRKADGDWVFQYRYKGGDTRRGVLPARAYQAICAYLEADGRPVAGMQAGSYLFVPLHPERALKLNPNASTEPNRPLSNHQANSILWKYGRRLGLPREVCHVHGLRHAGARLRIERKKTRGEAVDLLEVMTLLGHSSLAVTQIYAQRVLNDPEDPGGADAAEFLLPKGNRRRKRLAATQDALL
jgi:integrase